MLPPFVSVDWLRAHRDEVALADVRLYLDGSSAQAAYEAAHLPGAVRIDLESTLAGPGSAHEGRHPLPEPAVFAAGLAAAGIGDDSAVVAYDDAGGVMAARLVWLLRALGRDAALLDGGLQAWEGPTETGPAPPVTPGVFTAQAWPAGRLADIDEVQSLAAGGAATVVDARPRERFEGAPDALDPRFGHIPGARSLPCREHLTGGRLLPDEELRTRLAAAGVDGTTPVISACGSGVTACHNLLVMEHLGLPAGRLYPGSWSQYSHTDRPLETGP